MFGRKKEVVLGDLTRRPTYNDIMELRARFAQTAFPIALRVQRPPPGPISLDTDIEEISS